MSDIEDLVDQIESVYVSEDNNCFKNKFSNYF